MSGRAELLRALKEATRALSHLLLVNMQSRDDRTKLSDLADCRLEAKRVLPSLNAVIAKAERQS